MSVDAEFIHATREGGRAARVTVVASGGDPPVGAKALIRADGSMEGSLGDEAVDAGAREAAQELLWTERSERRELGDGTSLFVDVTAPPPRLLILGAVDYATALCRLARELGWAPYVCDPRSAFADPERFPEAEEVIAEWPDVAFERLGLDGATYIAVLTHDPKLDDSALTVALPSEAAYIGALGSRRTQAKRRARLLEQGLSEAQLDRIASPIGLDIGARTPAEVALSIMAQVVAVRNQADDARAAAA